MATTAVSLNATEQTVATVGGPGPTVQFAPVGGQGLAEHVAAVLGQPGDDDLIARAVPAVNLIASMAMSYTRGSGFPNSVPVYAIRTVIVSAASRLVANPAQVHGEVESAEMTDVMSTGEAGGTPVPHWIPATGFVGWTLLERMILDRYRQRTA